jgi:hypothetical protein
MFSHELLFLNLPKLYYCYECTFSSCIDRQMLLLNGINHGFTSKNRLLLKAKLSIMFIERSQRSLQASR